MMSSLFAVFNLDINVKTVMVRKHATANIQRKLMNENKTPPSPTLSQTCHFSYHIYPPSLEKFELDTGGPQLVFVFLSRSL